MSLKETGLPSTPSRPTALPPEPKQLTPARKEWSLRRLTHRPEMGALAGTLVVFIFFTITGGQQFIGVGGVASWMNIAAELAIVALPIGVLMISGEFDLSVGSIVAASSITSAVVSGTWHLPAIVGIVAALLVGLVAGYINGVVVTRTNVPSFIVTLAMQFALAGLTLGLARLITGSASVNISPDPVTKAIFGSLLGGQFEVAIIWALLFALVITWVLGFTKYGNWIFAVGGDKVSARAAGIPVAGTKIVLFMATGFGAALVGVLQTWLYNSAQTGSGQSFVFNSVIAVVIGGVLLTGGYGTVVGIILGCLTFAIVNQGIYYTGWNSDWAALILGVLLLAAVLMNNTFRRLALTATGKTKVGKAS